MQRFRSPKSCRSSTQFTPRSTTNSIKAPSRHETSLQAETLCCLGGVARPCGVDRCSSAEVSPHVRTPYCLDSGLVLLGWAWTYSATSGGALAPGKSFLTTRSRRRRGRLQGTPISLAVSVLRDTLVGIASWAASGKEAVNPELVDRIYESSLVPELWPHVLEELGRIAEGTGGSLFYQ
jgi:hypothetical protein